MVEKRKRKKELEPDFWIATHWIVEREQGCFLDPNMTSIKEANEDPRPLTIADHNTIMTVLTEPINPFADPTKERERVANSPYVQVLWMGQKWHISTSRLKAYCRRLK